MSIDFTGVKTVTVPEGAVKKITRKSDGVVLWEKLLLPAKDTLENTSWADIQIISKAGKASEYWSVGDQKTIYVNGVAYLVDIIGFDHDTPTDTTAYGRSKAGITFQLHDLLNTTYPMNNSNTNSGGWKSSIMRTSTMTVLLSQLASDLKAVIVPVDKQSRIDGSSSSIETTSDSLFLLSESETWFDFSNEGTAYTYYKNGGSTIKYDEAGYEMYWWLRTIINSDCFMVVSWDGEFTTGVLARQNNGVSFGFCV